MQKLLYTAVFTILFFGLHAQKDFDSSIRASFKIYKEAIKNVDRATLVKMEHPNIVKMGGGPSFYFDELTQDFNQYSAEGLKLNDLRIKESSKVVKAENDFQAMVPYIRSLERGSEIIKEENFFLATSQDGGKQWYFTDMKKYSTESIKTFIPNYNDRLNIFINSISH